MKVFIVCTFALIATVCADKSAPYPASGAKPNGPIFLLPVGKQAPAASPTKAPTYVYPYAPASPPSSPKAPEPTTANPQEVDIVTPNNTSPSQRQEVIDVGVYYILSPNGKLQKVEYFTAPQPESEIAQKLQEYNVNGQKAAPLKFKGVVSNFQYKDVEPITAPIFSYSNVPGPLVRILRRAD
nr:PREDICTED: uncharacterized protein LOC109034511 [Bemisia tabaci]